jgi:hypothetical protein
VQVLNRATPLLLKGHLCKVHLHCVSRTLGKDLHFNFHTFYLHVSISVQLNIAAFLDTVRCRLIHIVRVSEETAHFNCRVLCSDFFYRIFPYLFGYILYHCLCTFVCFVCLCLIV